MEKVEMVIRAVELAKQKGVLFDDASPTFRPPKNPKWYHVSILINTTPVSAGHAFVEEQLSVLADFNEIQLANRFVQIFNENNIERQANYIDEISD